MKYKLFAHQAIDFGNLDDSFFLIGLLNEFTNRFQAVGDSFFKEMSWKQCFLLSCIRFFKQPPTLKELSQLMGSSHQNVKQMLLKLEKTGYVTFQPDAYDGRKQRILLTEKANKFNEKHSEPSAVFMDELFRNIDKENLAITIQTILELDEQLKKMHV